MPAPCLPFIIHVAFNPASMAATAPRRTRRAVLPVAVAVGLLLVQLQKVESYILLLCQALLMCFGSSFLIECHHPTTAGSMCRYVTGLSEPGVPWYPHILADQLKPYLNRWDRLCRIHCYWPPRIIRPSYGPDICSMNRSSLGGKKSFEPYVIRFIPG